MTKNSKQIISKESILYSNILLLSRNRLFYTKFNLSDTFKNRIHLIFLHICFLFIKIKQKKLDLPYKIFYQKIFDLIFNKIEENMREMGYGDVFINKNMKSLVKIFYNILLNCETYREKNEQSKKRFLLNYLEQNKVKKHSIDSFLMKYFNKYEAFCFDLSNDCVLNGDLNFNFK